MKDLVRDGKVRFTQSAVVGGAAMGFSPLRMLGTVLALGTRDFRKSMTTYADHRIWQDVDNAQTDAGMVYLKLTVVDDVLVVSFKEC